MPTEEHRGPLQIGPSTTVSWWPESYITSSRPGGARHLTSIRKDIEK